jgi:predicted nucleic acid-binding protein
LASDRTFVDTNVLVYAVDDRDPAKQAAAHRLIAGFTREGTVLSTQVLLEYYATVTRKLPTPASEELAAAEVAKLAQLTVIPATQALVVAGIVASQRWQFSIWDGLIVAAAQAAGCRRLLSEDLTDGQQLDAVRVENPFA